MIEFLTGMIAGVVIAVVVAVWVVRSLVTRAEADIESILAEVKKTAEHIIPARIEQHDGVFYVYNTRDGSFIAQGASISEIKSRIEERMKDATVMVTEGDTDVLQRLRDTKTDAEAGHA